MQVDEFGYGIGLNPPLDIHIPDAEELAENVEKGLEKSVESIVKEILGGRS